MARISLSYYGVTVEAVAPHCYALMCSVGSLTATSLQLCISHYISKRNACTAGSGSDTVQGVAPLSFNLFGVNGVL